MRRLRRWVQVGAPDPWLTPVSGMAAVTALVDLLSMIKLLDMAIGQIADQGMRSGVHRWAAAGRVGHDAAGRGGLPGRTGPSTRRCAGQMLALVTGLSSTTVTGLARRFADG